MLDECSTLRADRAVRAVNTVQELAHGDDADRRLLFDRSRLRGASLAPDKDPRVDQDGQELSAGPMRDLISRSSAAKSLSTGGADPSSSRSRSGERRRDLGCPITAIVVPFRVTSISSPSATRLRIAEKLRAVSVALSRAIFRPYQINQIVVPPDAQLRGARISATSCSARTLTMARAIVVLAPARSTSASASSAS